MDNYYHLANHISDGNHSIISLNYDTLLDKAISHIGQKRNYWVHPSVRGAGVPIAKVHGSINWFNTHNRSAVGPSRGFVSDVAQIHNSIFSGNRVIGEETGIEVRSDRDLQHSYCVDLVENPFALYEPVIVPPVAENKNHMKVIEYNIVWNNARAMLSGASELVVIGSSIRRNDEKLRGAIQSCVSSGVDVTLAVGSNPEPVMDSLNSLIDGANYESYGYFGDYINHLR